MAYVKRGRAVVNAIKLHELLDGLAKSGWSHYETNAFTLLEQKDLAINWPDTVDKDQTLLMKALRFSEAFERMLKRGASVNIQNADGESVVHLVLKNGLSHLLEIILSHVDHVDYAIYDNHGQTPLEVVDKEKINHRLLHFGLIQATKVADQVSHYLAVALSHHYHVVDFVIGYLYLDEIFSPSSIYRKYLSRLPEQE